MEQFTRFYVYEGKFGEEQRLFQLSDCANVLPQKGDFVFYDEETYKVMYVLLDYDDDEYSVFVRKAIEEDF